MAELNLSLSDMPWLGQPADPAGSLIRGLVAGTGVRAQRTQASQNQQRLDLARRELAAELAQLPLKRTLMEQDLLKREIEVTNLLEQRDATLRNDKAFQSLSRQVASLMSQGLQEDVQPTIWNAIATNKGLDRHPGMETLIKDSQAGLNAKIALQQARNVARTTADTSQVGKFTTEINPLTNKPEAIFRSGPGSAQLVREDSESTTQFGRLITERNAALKAGDTDAVKLYDAKIQREATPTGMTLTTNKDGTFTLIQGAQPNLTVANQTRAQESLSNSIQVVDIANRLEGLISTETVGVRAFVESWAKDRILAQFFSGIASKDRASAEALAAQLRARAVQELKSDGNISDRERSQILQAVPDINAPVDSPERARQLITEIRKMSAIHAVLAASRLGQSTPPAAAQVLDTTELERLVKSGVLTPDQALSVFDTRPR